VSEAHGCERGALGTPVVEAGIKVALTVGPMGTPDSLSPSHAHDLFASPERLTLLLKAAQILVIDDEEANIRLVTRLLARAGHPHVAGLQDACRLETVIARHAPDLVITDLHMPNRDGFAVIEALQPLITASRLPVLVVSGDAAVESRNRALMLGARDFVSKPFDPTELSLRVRNQLETRLLFQDVAKQNRTLREAVHGRARELEEARLEMLGSLATAAEYRDDCTARHTVRVGVLAGVLAEALGLDPHDVDVIRRAAPLHDVGKVGVPDGLLRKPAKLTPEEIAVMRTHTLIGAEILQNSQVKILQVARDIALTHHEQWNGRGYPHGLVGTDIPLAGRIVAVADAFDAITNDRPYRPARSFEEAVAEIRRFAGIQFDPAIVDVLVRVVGGGAIAPDTDANTTAAAFDAVPVAQGT
jgi:putative two-component system response regulator